jgi:thiazole synthase
MDKLVIATDNRLAAAPGDRDASPQVMARALAASGAEIVTVALRRVDIDNPQDDTLREIDRDKFLLLPNTSGARTAEEAVRLARLARAATGIEWVKLEVTPDPYYLLPDPVETLKAAEVLVRETVVLPYINADPILETQRRHGASRWQPIGPTRPRAQAL